MARWRERGTEREGTEGLGDGGPEARWSDSDPACHGSMCNRFAMARCSRAIVPRTAGRDYKLQGNPPEHREELRPQALPSARPGHDAPATPSRWRSGDPPIIPWGLPRPASHRGEHRTRIEGQSKEKAGKRPAARKSKAMVPVIEPPAATAAWLPRPSACAQAQLKLKLMLIRSASTRLLATSWRSQLSNRITEPAVAG